MQKRRELAYIEDASCPTYYTVGKYRLSNALINLVAEQCGPMN